ncbi:hypothetical protein EV121DRAFT_254303 [Schizophyllum commune]
MLEAPPATAYFPCATRFSPQDASGPEYHLTALNGCEPNEDESASPELVGGKRLPTPIFPASYTASVYPDLSSPSSSESSAESYVSEPPFDRQADDDALRPYIESHQLVLDSTTPWKTPHIAICPTPQSWEQHVIPSYNSVPPQDLGHLGVAPRPLHDTCPLNTDTDVRHEGDEPAAHEEPGPARVFSHAAFAIWTQKTSVERLIFCSVVAALQRRNFQLVARAASQLAGLLYGRYEFPDAFRHIERPFVWSDQALPLLDASQHPPGTLILESDHPLSVPHIIITPEPNDDPWVAAMNLPTFPQDGRFLMVYYHNMQVWWGPEWLQAQMEAQWQYQQQYAQCQGCAQLVNQCCCNATVEAVAEPTPTPEETSYWPVEDDDCAQYASSPTTDESSCDESTPPMTPEPEPDVRPACNIFSVEEDDDELPSIEEWCKSLERKRGQS